MNRLVVVCLHSPTLYALSMPFNAKRWGVAWLVINFATDGLAARLHAISTQPTQMNCVCVGCGGAKKRIEIISTHTLLHHHHHKQQQGSVVFLEVQLRRSAVPTVLHSPKQATSRGRQLAATNYRVVPQVEPPCPGLSGVSEPSAWRQNTGPKIPTVFFFLMNVCV